MHTIEVPSLPPNNATYSQAVRLGNLIFVSGQLGIDPAGRSLPEGIEAQATFAIENIRTILESAGSGLGRVAKVTNFIIDFSLLPRFNAVYAQYFPHRPAKTTVEISRLDKGALIEIDVIAEVD